MPSVITCVQKCPRDGHHHAPGSFWREHPDACEAIQRAFAAVHPDKVDFAAIKKWVQAGLGIDDIIQPEEGEEFTLLQRAASCRRVDIVEWLLDKGADINNCAVNGETPLHAAVGLTHSLPLPSELPTILLERGADIHARDCHDHTPLHGAVMMGRVEEVQLLLSHKADVVAKDEDGKTPLQLCRSQLRRGGFNFEEADKKRYRQIEKILKEAEKNL